MGGYPQHLPTTPGSRPDNTSGLLPEMRVDVERRGECTASTERVQRAERRAALLLSSVHAEPAVLRRALRDRRHQAPPADGRGAGVPGVREELRDRGALLRGALEPAVPYREPAFGGSSAPAAGAVPDRQRRAAGERHHHLARAPGPRRLRA